MDVAEKVLGSYDPVILRLSGAGANIVIASPKFFVGLLKETLTGWNFEAASTPEIDIRITYSAGKYEIDSVVQRKPFFYDDLMDTLNEALLSICYVAASQIPDTALIHCAAYRSGRAINLLVGEKGSGKSIQTANRAVDGCQIFADDLALYFPKQGHFKALGLPIRLRRPIPQDLIAIANKDMLIPGKRIAYSRTGSFNIAPVGKKFTVTNLIEILAGGGFKPIPLVLIPRTIAKFKISVSYTTRIKPPLDRASL